MAHALFDVRLQRVVSRDSGRGVTFRFRRISKVGDAQIHVAAFVIGEKQAFVVLVGDTGRSWEDAIYWVRNGIAVGVLLRVRELGWKDVGRRGDAGLVERNGNDSVAAKVADVSDLDSQIVAWLPLNVERVVDGVRQLVGAVIGGKGEELLLR